MNKIVLILVVMEYGLRPCGFSHASFSCLNPCCNGIWSQTLWCYQQKQQQKSVLILVVMEYGLRLGYG